MKKWPKRWFFPEENNECSPNFSLKHFNVITLKGNKATWYATNSKPLRIIYFSVTARLPGLEPYAALLFNCIQ